MTDDTSRAPKPDTSGDRAEAAPAPAGAAQGGAAQGSAAQADAAEAEAARADAAQADPPGDAPAATGTDAPPPKTTKAAPLTIILMIGVALAGIVAILWAWRLWPFQTPIVVTENSYVRGQITVMAPQVSGYVAQVPVTDFERVVPGQVLIRIDDRIYAQRVAQSQGQRDAAAADLANAQQTLATDRATIQARRADLFSTQAELDRAKADETRVNELAARGSVSLRERDQIRATARAGAANVFKSKASIQIAQEQLKADEMSRSKLQAQLRTSDAQLALARIDLANTVIAAPRAGRLSQVSVRVGAYVTAGSQLLYLVPDTLWVIANYKETQTHAMHVGQSVSLTVDALDGAVVHGHVERLSPATGSEFSVIGSDNATGNFTKVVQRIPVRIQIDAGQDLVRRLRPGMSVITHVDTSSAAGTPDAR